MSDKLETDLKYNIINFKQNVLLTDLILEYKLNYTEVERLVEAHLAAEANRQKYERTYLVQGLAINSNNEIFTTVSENELEAAVKKLQNAQSNLYAVKLSGGAKSMPQPMKPLTYATIALKNATKEKSTETVENVEKKTEDKNVAIQKQSTTSEVKKVSPVEKKPLAEKGQIRKPASPKKLNDFFKKNATTTTTKTKPENKTVTKTTTTTTKATVANESMQLFEEEEEEEHVDEEKQDELRRELVAHPVEAAAADDDDEEEEYEMSKSKGSTIKRRRILDSDDEEEQPQAKQDKKVAEKSKAKEPEIEPGTYLDEDGFVLTVKPKKQSSSNNMPIRSSPRKPAVKSSPIKKTPKKRTTPKKAAPKTKQGSIMSFFGKK